MSSLGNNSYFPAIVVGLLVGYYAFHHLANFFVATLGALVGCLVALILISVLRIDNDLIVYLLIFGGIFIGFTGHFMTGHIELIMGVVSGSYLIVEGLTTFLGGLPSFMTGIQDLIHGGNNYFAPTIVYLSLFVFLCFYGYHYQRKF